jgi:hypothetical protein
MSSNLLNFGFQKLSKAEIKRRNEERALAYDPIEVERERAVKKEVQKLKAEEEAAQKAELARFLSMKRRQRFRERERLKKARDKENHHGRGTSSAHRIILPSCDETLDLLGSDPNNERVKGRSNYVYLLCFW